jgi:hypothetical protein
MSPCLSLADDNDTPQTKTFETCLSKCVYFETRPPPLNSDSERFQSTRGRVEILRGCKQQCAVSKDQLLLGKPKDKQARADTPTLTLDSTSDNTKNG